MVRHAVSVAVVVLAFAVACSGSEYTSGVAGGGGGQPAAAGSFAAGGSAGTLASGGSEPGRGGSSVAGGVGTAGEGSGGLGTGGDGSGGAPGSGGRDASGGRPAAGGAPGSGATPGDGGSPAAGGALGGGSPGAGGVGPGGNPGAGGSGTGGATSGGSAGAGVGGSTSGGSAGTAGQLAGGAAGTPPVGGAGGVDCDCAVGAYVPVCGVDGVTYDAACGRVCVPVEIACDGMCPCAGAGGSGGQGPDCEADCASAGFFCCDGRCVNLENDPLNCGRCGVECSDDLPYCNSGTCSEPPCSSDACSEGQTCCGTSCCTGSQICCLIMNNFWTTECVEPVDGTCPVGCPTCVCADPDTPVSTPTGERRIADLRVGDLVYTVDQNGVAVAPIVQTRQTPVRDHRVVRVELATGRVLHISGPHPTLDGRSFADLAAGEMLDGTLIVDVQRVAYEHPFTYDILPASDTGAYFAAGVAIGSTLLQAP